MSYPHVPAAFINAIAEEGTKNEAIDWLQKTWNENCALRAELKALRFGTLCSGKEPDKALWLAMCESTFDEELKEVTEAFVKEDQSLDGNERIILDAIRDEPMQYGELGGATLTRLIERGYCVVGDERSGFENNFIAKRADIEYRTVTITDAGRAALAAHEA
jgi:hypothetical protein